jgi:small-conductance mechanosensitive channel
VTLPEPIRQFFSIATLVSVGEALATLLISYLALKLLVFLLGRILGKRLSDQMAMVVRKAVLYTGMVVVIIVVLSGLGLDLPALLGAAGIAGIAIGFAAQTSVSNIISGFFLISEKPFAVGDVIRVGTTTGIIMGIDLLSIKVRTFDNQYIRIPNETIIKTEVTNITRFPIRRMNFDLRLPFSADLSAVKTLLLDVAAQNVYCLDDPEPFFVVKEFGLYGIEVLFGVWFGKSDFIEVKNSVSAAILQAFAEAGIEIPIPCRPEGEPDV